MLIFFRICIKHSKHKDMRKNNSKLNFMKNRQANKNLKMFYFTHPTGQVLKK